MDSRIGTVRDAQEAASYSAYQARKDMIMSAHAWNMDKVEYLNSSAVFFQEEAAHWAALARIMLGIV